MTPMPGLPYEWDEDKREYTLTIRDRLYNVVWTPRGSHTRIISLRKANGREIARYEQEKA